MKRGILSKTTCPRQVEYSSTNTVKWFLNMLKNFSLLKAKVSSACNKSKTIWKIFDILALFILLLAVPVFGDEIIINSKDWKDVYSGMQYSYLTGIQPRFLISERHSNLILNDIGDREQNINIFSSKKKAFVVGYEAIVEDSGFSAEETVSDSLSLEFAKKLENVVNFIIIDDSYPYNAISVAPYAIASGSFVLFADNDNIREIVNFLDSRTVDKVLIYGIVNREVRNNLDKYDPEIINQDGDKFANNIEIVKKYKEINNAKQVILTNGEFIESEIMSGIEPVLFIGKQNVPEQIKEYIKSSDIEVGVLIGNDLIGTATLIRRQTGISTFVKFARSAREFSGPISEVEDLDLFRMPGIVLDLGIESIRYNSATRQLYVTLQNYADVATYFKGTYEIISSDDTQKVGDLESVFIDSKSTKIMAYDVDPIAGDEEISGEAYIIFGESKNSLEFVLEQSFMIERVDIPDDAEIEIKKVVYDKGSNKFLIYLKNIGEVDAFIDTEILDLYILGSRQTLSSEKIIRIPPGKTAQSIIRADLAKEDLEDNDKVKVRAYYGESEGSLPKVTEKEFDVVIKSFSLTMWLPIIFIIILIILILFARKKKKKQERE